MATPADVIAQTSSINLISKSISATRSSVSSTSGSISTIQKIISTKTRIRNELFFKNQTLVSRRKEASRRRELEDQIEASKVTTNTRSGLKTASASSQGPFGRILSFLGYMGSGWIIENIPTWIAMGEEFIARMKKAGDIIYSIPNTMLQIIRGFGNVLESTGKNILSLDFTDSSDEIKNSFTELTDTIGLLGTQITDGFKLMLQPSGEVDIPSTGEQQPDTGFPDIPPVPSPGDSGGLPGAESPEMYRIAAALSTEGSGAQSTVDMMQVVVNRKASGKYGSSYTEILSRPSQFEGVEKKGVAGFKKIQTLQDASKWSGQSEATLLGIIKNIQNPSLQKSSAQYVGGAFEFRAAPGYYLKHGLVPGQMGPDGRFYGSGWRGGPGDNQFLKDPVRDKSRINPGGPASFNNLPKPIQQTPPKPTAPPSPVSTGTINLIPQTGTGGFIQGGSGSGSETTYATHFHIDAKTANPSAAQLKNIREVAFNATKVMLARGSTVYYGSIERYASGSDSNIRALIAAEQSAHGARSSAAVDIQESNPKIKRTFPSQPGSATKFPFAVGEVYYRGGYGREAEIIGSGGITVSHGAGGSESSGVSPKPSPISPQESKVSPKPSPISPQEFRVPPEKELQSSTLEQQPEIYSLSPEERKQVAEAVEGSKKGQQILFIDDRSLTQKPSATSVSRTSYGGGGSSGQITEFDMLNKFMKQKLLLDFNYL